MCICIFQCIETDESAKKPDLIKMPLSSEEEREAIMQLEQALATDSITPGKKKKSYFVGITILNTVKVPVIIINTHLHLHV